MSCKTWFNIITFVYAEGNFLQVSLQCFVFCKYIIKLGLNGVELTYYTCKRFLFLFLNSWKEKFFIFSHRESKVWHVLIRYPIFSKYAWQSVNISKWMVKNIYCILCNLLNFPSFTYCQYIYIYYNIFKVNILSM